jgi:hypothetical protein
MKRALATSFLLAALPFLIHSAPAAAAPAVAGLPATGHAQPAPAPAGAKAIPAAPSNLQVMSVTATSLTLTWTLNSSDATVIHIEVKTGSSGFTEIPPGVSGSSTGAIVTNLTPSTTYMFRVRASNSDGFSPYSNVVTVTTLAAPACNGSSTELCLLGGRFQIDATWRTSTATGNATVVQLTDDSGYLWFFAPTNPEVLLKVIDACSFNNQFWFFAGGLTNVRVDIHVTDTQTHVTKTYVNRLNTVFAPIQDTSAFPCP